MKCVTQKLTDMMNRLVIGYEIFFDMGEMKTHKHTHTHGGEKCLLFIYEFFTSLNWFETVCQNWSMIMWSNRHWHTKQKQKPQQQKQQQCKKTTRKWSITVFKMLAWT